jgi:hypothetical protein
MMTGMFDTIGISLKDKTLLAQSTNEKIYEAL